MLVGNGKEVARGLGLVLLLQCCCGNQKYRDWVISTPAEKWTQIGELQKAANLEAHLSLVELKGKQKKDRRVDGEAVDAISQFFWGMTNGVVLEMGAINGNWSSESLPLVGLGWKRVLIEGSPQFREDLRRWKDSYAYNAAICERECTVHYAVNSNYFVSGIIEFMPSDYIKKWYKGNYKLGLEAGGVFNVSKVDWGQVKSKRKRVTLHKLQCIPMYDILSHSQLSHINLMILDVEGAELMVLKSIDFTIVRFDVIVIENNREIELLDFFSGSDYSLSSRKGRNLWFVHKSFSPSVMP